MRGRETRAQRGIWGWGLGTRGCSGFLTFASCRTRQSGARIMSLEFARDQFSKSFLANNLDAYHASKNTNIELNYLIRGFLRYPVTRQGLKSSVLRVRWVAKLGHL